MGDFNHVTDAYLDREGVGRNKNSKILSLHRWLRSQDFQNIFRFLHPNQKEFTWSNNISKSRIDQIWVSENLVTGLKESTIEDMISYTSSDHQFVLATI